MISFSRIYGFVLRRVTIFVGLGYKIFGIVEPLYGVGSRKVLLKQTLGKVPHGILFHRPARRRPLSDSLNRNDNKVSARDCRRITENSGFFVSLNSSDRHDDWPD